MLARMQAPGPPSDSSRSTEAGDDWGGAASDSGDSEEDCDYAHEFWGEEAEADRGTSRLLQGGRAQGWRTCELL